jgi:hypothetical protein
MRSPPAKAIAEEESRHSSRDGIPDPEIDVRIEGRDDLLGIARDARHHDLTRSRLLQGRRLGHGEDLAVVEELIEEDAPLGQLEGLDPDAEPGAHLFEDAVHATAQEPARARDEKPIHHRPERERRQHQERPERQRDQTRGRVKRTS